MPPMNGVAAGITCLFLGSMVSTRSTRLEQSGPTKRLSEGVTSSGRPVGARGSPWHRPSHPLRYVLFYLGLCGTGSFTGASCQIICQSAGAGSGQILRAQRPSIRRQG